MTDRAPNVLLLGNGLLRTGSGYSWEDLLGDLDANERWSPAERRALNFPTLYQALAMEHAARPGSRRAPGLTQRVVDQIDRLQRPEILSVVDDLPVDHVLTTNYDYLIEGKPPRAERAASTRERLFSLFRWRPYGVGKRVWHIHGEANQPASIMLGADHYVSHTARVRDYLGRAPAGTGAWRQSHAKSPLTNASANRRTEFVRTSPSAASWVDHFLTGHVHVLGLGLDESETLLWWLLGFRQREASKDASRRRFHPGPITFYAKPTMADVAAGPPSTTAPAARPEAHRKLLQAFGMKVDMHAVEADMDYNTFYRAALGRIRRQMEANP